MRSFGRIHSLALKLPRHLCPPRLQRDVEPQGTVRWRHMLRSCVRCDCCHSKHKSQKPAASRRPPMGGEAIERRPASLTSRDCAPDSATSTLDSRLSKNVIAQSSLQGLLRQGQLTSRSASETVLSVSAQLCQERVRPLFFPLAPSRERRLNGFDREVWRLSTWRQKYLHRGWSGKPRRSHEIKTEAATGDGRP